MKQRNDNRRGRGRGPRKPHGMGQHGGGMNKPNQTYDSNGPDIRVRGNAHQVLEKYLQMARDAGVAGDRVAAENYLQHAEHYYRMISAQNEGQRPRVGGRELSVADVNVQNVSQGLSAALYATPANGGLPVDGQLEAEANGAPGPNGNYAPPAEGNNRFNAYRGGREGNGREGNVREGGNRDRDGEGRENNRRERPAMEATGGDMTAQPQQPQQQPPRRPSRVPVAPVSGDDQPDYPAELLPTVSAPAPRPQEPVVSSAAPEEQPSLALTPLAEAPATAEAGEAGEEIVAPKRGRGRPRGSTNRRTPRAAAGEAEGPVSAAPSESGE